MVGSDVKGSALQEMSEVLDGLVHRYQFPVEGAVLPLRWLQAFAKESDWTQYSSHLLL